MTNELPDFKVLYEKAAAGSQVSADAAPVLEEGAISMGSLSETGACKKARLFVVDLVGKTESENYYRTIIIKSAIINALKYKKTDSKSVMSYMRTKYPECGFKNYQQKQAFLLADHRRVMRYLKEEKRTPFFPKGAYVEINGKKVWVRPDVAFMNPNGYVEFVLFRIGKPDVTTRGKQNAFRKDMQLYALQLYGRALGYRNIISSFYFLKKSDDTQNWLQCTQSFFGDKNIVQKKDDYDPDMPNELDEAMKENLKKFEEGIPEESQCADTCQYCKKYDLCKYALPPAEMKVEENASVSAANGEVKFSDQQQEAIDIRKGVCRIVAGAGSGKTKTVVERVVRMLKEGVKPYAILMITFTKNGAEEMKRRIEKEIGYLLPDLMIVTFNAFENDIVMKEWQELKYSKKPRLIDDVLEFAVIADLLNENPILEWTGNSFLNFSTSKGFGTRGALRVAANVFTAVKHAKAEGLDPVIEAGRVVNSGEISGTALTKLVDLYDKYEARMKTVGLISFDDQELLTGKILNMHPDYMDENFQFKHVIVDEFQDTSEGQIRLVKKFTEMKAFESLMVVGDDAQSIYGFRNTTPEYIINFERYIGQKVRDIVLDKNFRSTPQICRFGSDIIDLNVNKVDKLLVPTRDDGMPVIVNGFMKQADEYAFIAKNIRQHLDIGVKPEDIAILAYTKAELRKIADVLTKAGIPSMFGAPEPLMENSRIRATLAFMRLIRDPSLTADAAVCANALLGGGLMDLEKEDAEARIAEMVARAEAVNDSFDEKKKEMFIDFMKQIAFGDEALDSFREQLEEKEFDEIIDYLRDFSLYGDGVEYRRTHRYPGVLLITAHSSKGLEWKIVYNTITKYPFGRYRGEREETRRLFFVSTTRARDELYVSGVCYTGAKEHPVRTELLAEAYDIVGRPFPACPA